MTFHKAENNNVYFKLLNYVLILQYYLDVYIIIMTLKYTPEIYKNMNLAVNVVVLCYAKFKAFEKGHFRFVHSSWVDFLGAGWRVLSNLVSQRGSNQGLNNS